jgi:hypothetical protein
MASPELGEPAVTDIYQVHIKGTLFDQTIRTILHYKLKTVGVGIDGNRWDFYQTIFDKVTAVGGVISRYRDTVSEDFSFDYIRIQRVGIVRQVFRQFAYLFDGSLLSDSSPSNVAVPIVKRTGTIGRHGHGTLHLAGFPKANMVGNEWSLIPLATVTQLAEAIDDEINGAGGEYQLVPCLAPEPDSIAPPAEVTAVEVVNEVRIMRRRTKGIGE